MKKQKRKSFPKLKLVQQTEVQYLRALVRDLMQQIIGLASGGVMAPPMTMSGGPSVNVPSIIDQVMGKVVSMEAVTDKDKKDKAAAQEQINSILGVR